MGAPAQIRAEEAVRALAAAAAAVRLYPPTSEIPAQTVERFVQLSAAVTGAARGPVRFIVEPKAFRLGDQVMAEGQAQVTGLAELLYAHQVGQLIIAPDLMPSEVVVFLHCATSDPTAVREEGGLRNVIVTGGVTHLAVIEVTLRASTEEGLAGIDLTSAPLDVIGPAVVRAAADWARSAAGGAGTDEVAAAVDGLESAARELASERVAQALLHLDEQTRAAVLAAAVRPDAAGHAMGGMLSVIANMKPATLARLLVLASARTGGDTDSLMAKLELPPEALRALQLMLRPSARREADSGVPARVDAAAISADVSAESDEDEAALRAAMLTRDAVGETTRALDTTLRLIGDTPTAEGIEALADVVPHAVAAGAFGPVRRVLALLDRVKDRPGLDTAATRAQRALAQPETLARGVLELREPAQARDAAAVLSAAGTPGAEALLDGWLLGADHQRLVLENVASVMPEPVLAAAGRRMRAGDATTARDLAHLLGRIGDRRAVSSLAQALDHDSGEVRNAAIASLAHIGTEDAWATIVSMLTHPDEPTALAALAAIGQEGRRQAVPAMLAVLQLRSSGTRNHRLKREIIEVVTRMRAGEAVPVLKKLASKRVAVGRRSRELREAARRAVTELQSAS